MANDRIPMTQEGYDKLKKDLDRMQHFEMIEVAKRIAAARDLGDLSENAEYHAAREDQGMLQARIDALKEKLSRAFLIDKSALPTNEVAFGAVVRVFDLDAKEEETFHLVGPGVNRKTGVPFRGIVIWGVHLRPGTYHYRSDRNRVLHTLRVVKSAA